MLDNTPYQPTKFRTKNWFKVNDDACETYNNNSQIKFETFILKSSLHDYIDAYKLVSGAITDPDTGTAAVSSNRKNIITKNCAPFTNCMSK